MTDPAPVVPVLMYHSLSAASAPSFRRFTLDPGLFDAHLDHLDAHGYRTTTIGELVRRRGRGEPVPERTVVLTFDDGFVDFHTHALPALARRGMTASLFVVTGHVGATSAWLRAEGEGDRPLLDWEQLREVAGAGIECASHTHTHPQLDVLPAGRVRDELLRSRGMLEERLQRAVPSLAYPYGYHDAGVRALAAGLGYLSACAVADRVDTGATRFAVPRLTVPAATGTDDLQALLDRGVPGRAERGLRAAEQLVWRRVRRHGPRAVVGATASGVPAWARGRR